MKNILFKKGLFLLFSLVFFSFKGQSPAPCPCPAVPFDSIAPSKYEIIFCGTVKDVKVLNNDLHTVIFEVNELYKGNVTKTWEVHFKKDDPCAVEFKAGDEWLMFLNYYQNNNSKLNWCSHSRKYFRTKTDDPFWISSGWEYEDVKSYLKKKWGTYKILENVGTDAKGRNVLPNRWEFFIYLFISVCGMFLIYYIVKKYF